MPVALAPVGLTGMQHPDGEIAAARAANAFGVPFTLSTMSVCSIEAVAEATGQPTERIERDCDRNKWLDEKEMLEYGLIDTVLTSMPAPDKS